MERSEYLKRPLIEDVVFEIDEKHIKIFNASTLFIDIYIRPVVELNEVRRNFRELKKAANISEKLTLIGSTKYLPTVKALYPGYLAAVEKMKDLFSEIVIMSRQLQAEGIHFGNRDDELLEAITVKTWEYNKLFYRNSDYSLFMNYYNRVKEILDSCLWMQDDVNECRYWIA